jgi:putative PEP-CTERM system histidine kinase
VSSATGVLAFLLLSVLLVAGFRGSRISAALIGAGVCSALWFALHVYYYRETANVFAVSVLQWGEIARDGAWFLFLATLLSGGFKQAGARLPLPLTGAALGLAALLAAYIAAVRYGPIALANYRAQDSILLMGFLGLAVVGLVLTEQLYRNTQSDRRWAIRYLCLGIGAVFAYDFFIYADALLFKRINPDYWVARGAVNALAVPLIAVSAARNRDWNTNLFVSRSIVFHSGTIIAAGVYLLLMAAAGLYLRTYGGTWGGALQIVFTVAAIVLLVAVFFSAQVRIAIKRFIAKHFYRNKYEYGQEWLNFTRRLSTSDDSPAAIKVNIIAAVADIMGSPGGLLWERDDGGEFAVSAQWNMPYPAVRSLGSDDPGMQRVAREQWVVDLKQYATRRDVHEATPLPGLFTDLTRAWLLIPICHRDEMIGFLVLHEPGTPAEITLEDVELLRTVGRQAASYLVLLRTTERLAEARQFEAYNKLSAFLVHDLKNVIAQFALIQQNAVKHRHNPDFVEDTFNTINAAVSRMNHMLAGLRQGGRGERPMAAVGLEPIIEGVVKRRRAQTPPPRLTVRDQNLSVFGDAARLESVVEHLVQNAQEATPADGEVEITLARRDRNAVIVIRDSGAGMTQEFIDQRLFKPFDSTKGNAGMGIGVYESRHVIQEHGGRIEVWSRPRQGTTFTITLPLLEESQMLEALAE